MNHKPINNYIISKVLPRMMGEEESQCTAIMFFTESYQIIIFVTHVCVLLAVLHIFLY